MAALVALDGPEGPHEMSWQASLTSSQAICYADSSSITLAAIVGS
jgi:hypothetical protein